MKLAIILSGDHSGELDRHTFDSTEDAASDSIRTELEFIVAKWTFSPGDVIRVIEVD